VVKKDAASQCSDTDQEQNKVWLNKRDNYDFKQDGDFLCDRNPGCKPW